MSKKFFRKKKRLLIILPAFVVIILGTIIFFVVSRQQQPAGQNQTQNSSNTNGSPYSTSTPADQASIPAAKDTQIIELADKQAIILSADKVKKTINGSELLMFGYDGMIPGPTFKVKQGSRITVLFVNNSDKENTIHPHGLRLDNKSDGVPYITQNPVPVGGSYEQTLSFPDAGMYWYHPHEREDYAQESGLYGTFLVEPAAANYWNPVNREVPVILDDILLTDSGFAPFYSNKANYVLMGRYGNTMFTNGSTDYSLNVDRGEVVRLYLVNGANARPIRFRIAGKKLKLVGSDNGKYETEQWVDWVDLSPGEREIIEILFDKSGSYDLLNDNPLKQWKLGSVNVSDKKVTADYSNVFAKLRANSDVISEVAAVKKYFTKNIDKEIHFRFSNMMSSGMGNMPGTTQQPATDCPAGGCAPLPEAEGSVDWEDEGMANAQSSTDTVHWKIIDEQTKAENMQINWTFNQRDYIKIRVVNEKGGMFSMQHPLHFHGLRFLVLDTNGKQTADQVWKDTVMVGSGDTIDLLLQVTNKGTWMAHCHIAEHVNDDMMFFFEVK